LAASKPASATKHLFDPFPVLLAPLESWIFLLLWMVSFINHKGHEVTRRGTLLRFRSYSVVSFVVEFGRYPVGSLFSHAANVL